MLSAVLPVPAQEVQGHRGFTGSLFELKRKIVCLQVINEEGKEQPSQRCHCVQGHFLTTQRGLPCLLRPTLSGTLHLCLRSHDSDDSVHWSSATEASPSLTDVAKKETEAGRFRFIQVYRSFVF